MGAVCSYTAGNSVVSPLRQTDTPSPESVRHAPRSSRASSSKKIGWSGGKRDSGCSVVDVTMRARPLPIEKAAQTIGLESEVYKLPAITLTVTVKCKSSTPAIIQQPSIDWGKAKIIKQVPQKLPESLSQGTLVVHALLAKGSSLATDIKLTGTLGHRKVEYGATVEETDSLVSDPIVLADMLQVLQEQLYDEANREGNPKGSTSRRNFSTDTGYSTCTKAGPQSVFELRDSINEDLYRNKRSASERKNTPAVSTLTRPARLPSLKGRTISLLEEEEETEDDMRCPTNRRVSRLSRVGRMSRLGRRFSYCSIGADSCSSMTVHPPGRVASLYNRKGNRKTSHWSERCSITEYRQRPGEVSDFETSAGESEKPSLCSFPGASDRRSSIDLCPGTRRVSFDRSPAVIWGDGRDDNSQTEASSKCQSGDEQASQDYRYGCHHYDNMKPKRRQRRPTPVALPVRRRTSLCLASPVNVIAEEVDPGMETETDADGYISESIQMEYSSRKKQFPKFGRLGYSAMWSNLHNRLEPETSASVSTSQAGFRPDEPTPPGCQSSNTRPESDTSQGDTDVKERTESSQDSSARNT